MENNVLNNSNSLDSFKSLDYKSFAELCSVDCNIDVHSYYKFVVNFFINNRKQSSTVYINLGDSFIDRDMLNCFGGFSVIPVGEFKTVNKYLVFIDPNDIEDSYFNEIEQNLPMSAAPTHVCILSNDKEVISKSFEVLLGLNKNLTLVNINSTFDASDELTKNVNKLLNGKPTLSIANYCKELSYMFFSINEYSFYKRFDEIVDNILRDSKAKVVTFGGDYMGVEFNLYKLIVTECCLRNPNFKFYIEQEYANEISMNISSCLFDPKHQLVEDVVAFIENFPKICLETRGDYLLTNLIKSAELTLKVKYVPLHTLNKSEVKFNKIKSNSVKIAPLSSFYSIETEDIDHNMREEVKLRKFIKELYPVLDLESGIIDLTNLVFFSMDGIDYVGHNIGYDLNLECKSSVSGMILTDRRITNFYDLNKFLYIPYFLNREGFIKNISSRIGVARLSGVHAKVLNRVRKNTSIFKFTSSQFSQDMMQFDNIFYLMGMTSKETRIFRDNVCKDLTKVIGLDTVRNKVDSFGGFNKLNNPILEI